MDSFFGIGAPELILILIIAGVVMGPERIVHIARWFGKTTAQLQSISRSFMRQLNQELDGVDDGGALKSALGEMKMLRQELEELKGEFVSVSKSAAKEGESALQDIKDIPNSILPASLAKVATPKNEQNGETETAVSDINNNDNGTTPAPTPTNLPTPLEITDDLE